MGRRCFFRIFRDDALSEFYYYQEDGDANIHLSKPYDKYMELLR